MNITVFNFKYLHHQETVKSNDILIDDRWMDG